MSDKSINQNAVSKLDATNAMASMRRGYSAEPHEFHQRSKDMTVLALWAMQTLTEEQEKVQKAAIKRGQLFDAIMSRTGAQSVARIVANIDEYGPPCFKAGLFVIVEPEFVLKSGSNEVVSAYAAYMPFTQEEYRHARAATKGYAATARNVPSYFFEIVFTTVDALNMLRDIQRKAGLII